MALIARAMMPAVDVFKIDIDSFDCDVIPRVLHAYSPALLIVEYNVPVSACCYICVRILLYMCPHTAIYASAYH